MKLTTFFFFGLLAAAVVAEAQETTSPEPAPQAEPAVQSVEVSGMKNPEFKPYRQMLKGIDAFDQFRELAPAAPLKFQLVSDSTPIAFDKVTLRIAGENTAVPLAVDTDGTFVLPRLTAAADDNAEIISNLRKGLLRWRSDIHSPNVPANARRLGDLRLECEIGWAINRQDMSFVARNSLSMMGGLCHAKMVGLRYQAPRPLAGVSLVSGERKLALQIDPKSKRVFWPPLADKSWDNESLVVYEYETSPSE